ncbi:MAG: O-antigen ligase family protein, partial [Bacteroidetes bacterium]|nr:O-antigen ligase family protein [Bacteroidota bacterium]
MRILLASIYPFAFMLLFVIIPFDDYIRALPNILLIILTISFPAIIKREHFQKIKKVPLFLLLLFFGYIIINSILSGRFDTDISILKKIAIAIGLVVLYLPIQYDRKVQKAVIFSSIAAIVFSIVSIVYSANTNANFEFGDSRMMIEALLVDRLYLGLISVLSVLFCYRSMRKTYHPHNAYYLGAIAINVLFIVLVVSKIAGIVLFCLLLIRQAYGGKKSMRIAIATAFVAVLVAGLFFLKSQQETSAGPVSFSTFLNKNFGASNTSQTRLITWGCSMDVLQNRTIGLTGIGFKATKDELVACYQTAIKSPEKKEVFISQRYNSHNQFLDILLSTGFVGLFLLCLFLIWSFMKNREHF